MADAATLTPPALPLTLYPSRKRVWLLLVAGPVMIAVGVMLIQEKMFHGWFAAVIGGLCIPLGLAMLHPRFGQLTIDEQGFESRWLRARLRFEWDQVAAFGVIELKQKGITVGRYVGITIAPGAGKSRIGSTLNRLASGYDSSLPDNFGLSAEDLARLLEIYRQRHMAAAGPK